jgi:hypothetical protein
MRTSLSFIAVLAACAGPGGDPAGPDASGAGAADAAMSPTTIKVTLSEHAPTTTNLVAAFQDGDHAWQVAPPVGDTYTFVVTSATWRFAWACEATLDYERRRAVNFISFAVSDRTSFVAPESCPRFLPVVKIAGTIVNLPSSTTSNYDVFFGELSGAYLAPPTNGTMKFEVSRLRGTHHLYATVSDVVSGSSRSVTKLAVSRGVVANANVSNATIDFANVIATTSPVAVTTNAPASTETAASTTLYDPSGTQLRLTYSWAGPPHTSRALPAAQVEPGSVYEQKIQARTCTSTYCDEVETQHWTTNIAAQTVVLPAALGTTTMSADRGSIAMAWPSYPAAIGYRWFAIERSGGLEWSGIIGPGEAPRFTIPDLSALAGWSDYVRTSSNEIVGQLTAVTSSAGAGDFPPAYPAPAGTDRVLASSPLSLAGN